MGISRGYSTPIAMDIMRAFHQGARRGAMMYGVLGFSIGLTVGIGLAMYAGSKIGNEEKTE